MARETRIEIAGVHAKMPAWATESSIALHGVAPISHQPDAPDTDNLQQSEQNRD
jgi:hypothetical protein